MSKSSRYILRGGLSKSKKVERFYYLFLASLGRHCCARAFSSCGEQRLLFIALQGLLNEMASLAAKRGLCSKDSIVVAHGFSCSGACGIFPDQGLNSCPLHWQADS